MASSPAAKAWEGKLAWVARGHIPLPSLPGLKLLFREQGRAKEGAGRPGGQGHTAAYPGWGPAPCPLLFQRP